MKRNEIFIAVCSLFIGVLVGQSLSNYKYSAINQDVSIETEVSDKKDVEDTIEPNKDKEEIYTDDNIPKITIDNGINKGDNRYLIYNGEIIDTVSGSERIYDYEPYYVTININEPQSQLVFVNRYTAKRTTYEFPKVEDGFIPYTEGFDKKEGIITINCGVARYEFNTNTREFNEI